MRAVLVRRLVTCAALAVPAIATASPKLGVWNDRVIGTRATTPLGPVPLTSVSHTLYLNNCMPNGCTVSPGFDNSLTNKSSIVQSLVTLDAYAHGDAHWNSLVECVKETFKPFDIDVVTVDPGQASHFEVMIGGTSRELNPNLDAGGVAPFIDCGATRNNAISFVFASQTSDLNFLCGAVAQEAAHIWGLDHELDADDPMTYLDLGSLKRFQNSNPSCGEDTPRHCRCGGNTQNSFVYMRQTFGLNPDLTPPTVSIAKPRDGQWVPPEFPISASYSSELAVQTGTFAIDDSTVESFDDATILAWNAPASLSGGAHTIKIDVKDAADRDVSASVKVNVMQSCASGASCPGGFSCFAGLCTPGANEIGGLGSDCSDNGECATGKCASDGTDSLCTGNCEGDGSCPSGFECVTESNLCWPSSSGGCATTTISTGRGNGTGALIVFALGGLLLVRRRRGSTASS